MEQIYYQSGTAITIETHCLTCGKFRTDNLFLVRGESCEEMQRRAAFCAQYDHPECHHDCHQLAALYFPLGRMPVKNYGH